jgi:hypothetical protein
VFAQKGHVSGIALHPYVQNIAYEWHQPNQPIHAYIPSHAGKHGCGCPHVARLVQDVEGWGQDKRVAYAGNQPENRIPSKTDPCERDTKGAIHTLCQRFKPVKSLEPLGAIRRIQACRA